MLSQKLSFVNNFCPESIAFFAVFSARFGVLFAKAVLYNGTMKKYGGIAMSKLRENLLPILMVCAIVSGCLLGAFWPGAVVLEPLGTIFINLMFCMVVPLVFSSVAGAIGSMGSARRAGRIMGTAVAVFVITGLIAAAIMLLAVQIFPPVLEPWQTLEAGTVDSQKTLAQLIVGFFTAEDFVGLLSRRAMLPLIVFSVLFGFALQKNGGSENPVTKFLNALCAVMQSMLTMLSWYAPVAFFGFFATLTASYGLDSIASGYGRALGLYYPLCILYLLIFFPLYARLGGGSGAAKLLFKKIGKPAAVALGTCSSVAAIPTNLQAAGECGVPKDVAEMTVPLGATMHMDGSCFASVLKAAFLCGVFGMPLNDPGQMITVALVAVLSAVGMSGIPGGGYIGEYLLCSILFPGQVEVAYPIAVAIGNLVDPPATMINSAGDLVACFLVARFTDGKDWLRKKLGK
jgi:Na+/H+-dicarboxylate symporter